MKKRINLILILIVFCTIGLIGLQSYWNYSAYNQANKGFKTDINDALKQAIEQEADLRRASISKQYKSWLTDTNLILIGSRWETRHKETAFTIADKHPPFNDGRQPFNLELRRYKKVDHLTPEIKAYFIQYFTDNVLSKDLKEGVVYFYTQRLGDLLDRAYEHSRIDTDKLKRLYQRELSGYDIQTDFVLDTGINNNKPGLLPYQTNVFHAGLRIPWVPVSARFGNPDVVVLKRVRWILVISLLLIAITIFCFAYTVKTMLSQKKIAELKDDFVNNMTHELKTPIATIGVAAEAIQNFNLSKASANEYLCIIRYQAENLTQLIEQILSSMVNEQAVIKLNREVVSLTNILNNCISQYQPQLLIRNTSLSLDIDETAPLVNGDSAHLGNVMANLLDNAIKYGNEQPVISIHIYAEDEQAIFKITNNGKGIPREYHNKVFERFFRVPTGNIHNVKGYGLGLSYVSDIVRRHQGSIKMKSTISTTTFIIQLPLAQHEIIKDIIA